MKEDVAYRRVYVRPNLCFGNIKGEITFNKFPISCLAHAFQELVASFIEGCGQEQGRAKKGDYHGPMQNGLKVGVIKGNVHRIAAAGTRIARHKAHSPLARF